MKSIAILALVAVAVVSAAPIKEEKLFLDSASLGMNLPDSYIPKSTEMYFNDTDLMNAFDAISITNEKGETHFYPTDKAEMLATLPEEVKQAMKLSAGPSGGSYNLANARMFARYAAAAYCVNKNNGASITSWTCSACKQVPKLSDITLFRHAPTNTNGFGGYHSSSNTIIISFAGTEMTSIRNWITDLIFKHVDYSRCSGCQVHLGFYNAFLTVGQNVIDFAKKLRSKYPTAKIAVTGHSLGGALATHALFALSANSLPLASPVYSYGQPRVGNSAFAKAFENRVGQFRVVHYKDPVPQVPLIGMDFAHPPTEIYETQGEGSYKVCSTTNGEDTSCSYKTSLPWLPDAGYHLQYGGFDFGSKTC